MTINTRVVAKGLTVTKMVIKPTKPTSSSVMKAIENATKEANAYDFIKNLPSGLETNCGKKGSQLSGKTLIITVKTIILIISGSITLTI